MSAISDPDRLERLAVYVLDDPPNALPREVADALRDAAARIRRHQLRDQATRALLNGRPCPDCEGLGYRLIIGLDAEPNDAVPCPNPGCVNGRQPGVIERLEIVHAWIDRRRDKSLSSVDMANHLAAVLAHLRQHGGPSGE